MRSHRSRNGIALQEKLIGSLRNRIQWIIFILTLAMGFQFYLFVFQAGGDGAITVPRPEGVEAFLPIGALMGWKYYLTTGIWDTIHPASMIFVLFAVSVSILLRKAFCSWFCPVGTLSEWAWKMGERIFGRSYRLPKWIDLPLRSSKYLLLSFFVYIIGSMSPAQISSFLQSPYYMIADVKMLHFFTKISLPTAVVLLALTVMSVFIRNAWCRYACPYGALLGIASLFSTTRIKRNEDTCTSCGECRRACPFDLPVDQQAQVLSPVCSGCMDCVNDCPTPDTLKLSVIGSEKTVSTTKVGVLVVVFFWSLVFLATVTGHWKSNLSDNDYRMWLKTADQTMIKHPTVK